MSVPSVDPPPKLRPSHIKIVDVENEDSRQNVYTMDNTPCFPRSYHSSVVMAQSSTDKCRTFIFVYYCRTYEVEHLCHSKYFDRKSVKSQLRKSGGFREEVFDRP